EPALPATGGGRRPEHKEEEPALPASPVAKASRPERTAAPFPATRIARRLALVLQSAPMVLDAQEGFVLAQIGERPVRCAALADDASVGTCDESGAITLERLATHLSIGTT